MQNHLKIESNFDCQLIDKIKEINKKHTDPYHFWQSPYAAFCLSRDYFSSLSGNYIPGKLR